VRIVFTFGLLTMINNFYFPTVAVVILAILNDGCMITISKDRVRPSLVPDEWRLPQLFATAIAYGSWMALSTLIFYEIVWEYNVGEAFGLPKLSSSGMCGLIYLQVSISGLATIFITRTDGFFCLDRPGAPVLIAFWTSQLISSLIGGLGLDDFQNFGGCGPGWVLVAWVWSIFWFLPMDLMKVLFKKYKVYSKIKNHCYGLEDTGKKGDDITITITGRAPSLDITVGNRQIVLTKEQRDLLIRDADHNRVQYTSKDKKDRKKSVRLDKPINASVTEEH